MKERIENEAKARRNVLKSRSQTLGLEHGFQTLLHLIMGQAVVKDAEVVRVGKLLFTSKDHCWGQMIGLHILS